MARDARSLKHLGQVVLIVNSCLLIGMLLSLVVSAHTGNAPVWRPIVAVLLGIFLLGTIALSIIAILVRRRS